jgi:hypothetical protein
MFNPEVSSNFTWVLVARPSVTSLVGWEGFAVVAKSGADCVLRESWAAAFVDTGAVDCT